MNSHILSQTSTSAPALNRGLAVLAALNEKTPLSLEELVGKLSLPKASVFRLLGTLQQLGLIQKNHHKTYEALWKLVPLTDSRHHFRQSLSTHLKPLTEATGCTVEWYEASEEGMRLILQELPECEVRVQAKPGFVRHWRDECDAVAQLGYAFATEAPSLTGMKTYVANGILQKQPLSEIRSRVSLAHEKGTAFDPVYNSNGVRRIAVAALPPSTQTFCGVLALAECVQFTHRSRTQTFLTQLQQTLDSIHS